MAERERRRAWNLLAIATVLGALVSVANTAGSVNIPGCFNDSDCGCTQQNCSAPGQGGVCIPTNFSIPGGTCLCNPGYGGPTCDPLGACCGVDICAQQGNAVPGCAVAACTELTAADCAGFNGTFAGNSTTCGSGICDPTATPTTTATVTQTPTVTSTPTPVSQGGGCTDVSQCAPGLFCSDAVCCDTACTGPLVSCNQPGQVGTCAGLAAKAPAASNGGLLLMVSALIAVAGAALGLRARRR